MRNGEGINNLWFLQVFLEAFPSIQQKENKFPALTLPAAVAFWIDGWACDYTCLWDSRGWPQHSLQETLSDSLHALSWGAWAGVRILIASGGPSETMDSTELSELFFESWAAGPMMGGHIRHPINLYCLISVDPAWGWGGTLTVINYYSSGKVPSSCVCVLTITPQP